MPDVTVIDYGVGNLASVRNAFRSIGVAAETATAPRDLNAADVLVLPGVGAFSHCMDQIDHHGLREFLIDYSHSGRPLLGICVGMQVLFEQSTEFGSTAGLGLVPGGISRLEATSSSTGRAKVPHVGWAPLTPTRPWEGTFLEGLDSRASYYFVHSYAPRASDPAILAEAHHGPTSFGAVVGLGNTFGCQFHPERSGPAGLAFLRSIVTAMSRRDSTTE